MIKPVALITGASSGLGKATAEHLARTGWRVFGTSRRFRETASGNIEMLQLDVCEDDSIANCVDTVIERAGTIDVLVNNAGFVLNGFVEECTLAQARSVMETNFFGVVRMTNAVLPHMRTRRNGRIINISSLAGLIGSPYRAFYSASKYALEGYTQALNAEVRGFGIYVSMIEPGFFKTGIVQAAVNAGQPIEDYNHQRAYVDAYFGQGVRHGSEPARLARLVERICRSSRPRLRYRIGPDSVWLPRLQTLLPKRLFTLGVRWYFKLD
ncbi:MAG: SDR family NAD(P)-dependent oxidoreductase [Sedimentisphaerales bacterium]|nr:SDR family NAD(P)-dependent oxidoreductase [Sedimentisphaerales bacterium]